MINNVAGFSDADKEILSLSQRIKLLDRTLYGFPFKIIEYVRNGNNVNEVRERAANATRVIEEALQELLNPVIQAANNIANDPTANPAKRAAARNQARYAGYAQKCAPGYVWDPVTETCVAV